MPESHDPLRRRDHPRDLGRETTERVVVERWRTSVAGKIRGDPASRPAIGELPVKAAPHVAGRAQPMEQDENRIAGTAGLHSEGPGQPAAPAARVHRIGSRLTPRWKLDRRKAGSPAYSS